MLYVRASMVPDMVCKNLENVLVLKCEDCMAGNYIRICIKIRCLLITSFTTLY
jgi:hypothetical protein